MASAGRILPISKGDWVAGATYKKLDFVYYGGSTFIAKNATSGTTDPATDTENWQILSGGLDPETVLPRITALETAVTKQNTIHTATLEAGLWSTTVPYSQTVNILGMTEDSHPDYYIDGDPSEAEYEAFCHITSASTAADTMTFKCNAEKPETTIKVMVRGI